MGRRSARRIERDLTALRSELENRLVEITRDQLGSTATVARLPVTVAARTLIADVCASLPVVAVRDGAVIDPTPSLLVRPDPTGGMTRRRFVHRAVMSLTGWGNIYGGVMQRGYNGWPLNVALLHPDTVAPIYGAWGIEGWTLSGQEIDPLAVVHVPLSELTLEPVARSPLADAQSAFDDLAMLWAYASGYYRDGGKPPYTLRHPGRLDSTQAGELLDQWIEARRNLRPGMLSGGIEIEELTMPSAQDALLLDGLAYLDQQVGRIFGVTPTLLNIRVETGSLTYSNTAEEVRRWLSLSLFPTWLCRLEDLFTQMLPDGQQAIFDTRALTSELGLVRPGLDEARPGAAGPSPTAATGRTYADA